jgi:hypothetical protein
MNPHPGVENPEAIEVDYQMKHGMLVLNMRAPLVGYALGRWSVDCSLINELDPKSHHLYLKKSSDFVLSRQRRYSARIQG